MRRLFDTIIQSEAIDAGWSIDKKYRVTTEDGSVFLLRITEATHSKNRELLFSMMQKVNALGIPMCEPIEYGECPDGVYSLQGWIVGKSAEEIIPALLCAKQYEYGFISGQILKKIHTITPPTPLEDWEVRFNRKIDRKMKMSQDCPIKYKELPLFIDYIEANRKLLKNRPQTFMHGDYHIGNMMMDLSDKLHIIDFDRYGFGDPWEEFNRIVWCAQVSPEFASGQVDGYFDNSVPLEFWRLLALYISNNTLSSVPWATAFGQEQIDIMLNQAKQVAEWYDGMKRIIPSWYVQRSNGVVK